MPYFRQPYRGPWRPDVAVEWTDQHGNRFVIDFDLRLSNDTTTIVGLAIRGATGKEPLTQTIIRSIPLEKILREELNEVIEMERRQVSTTVGPRRGRAGLPDQVLVEVAEIYRDALRRRQPVQQAVADAMQISRSAAAKRIMSARQKGLITNEHETETR